ARRCPRLVPPRFPKDLGLLERPRSNALHIYKVSRRARTRRPGPRRLQTMQGIFAVSAKEGARLNLARVSIPLTGRNAARSGGPTCQRNRNPREIHTSTLL